MPNWRTDDDGTVIGSEMVIYDVTRQPGDRIALQMGVTDPELAKSGKAALFQFVMSATDAYALGCSLIYGRSPEDEELPSPDEVH